MNNAKLTFVGPFMLSSIRRHSLLSLQIPVFTPTGDGINNQTATTAGLSLALQHYINSDTPRYGQKIHAHILKTGFRLNTNISIKLLILHLKCGSLTDARQLFDELPHRTLSAYNYMIGGYLKQGLVDESISLVRGLIVDGERPDGFTLSMILKASVSGGNVMLPRNIEGVVHAQILKLNVEEADDVLYTALVDSYVKRGNLIYARRVFDMMMEENVICSTSMISGYMNQGFVEDAEEIFKKTVEKDIVVFNAMIEGYSKSVETAKKALEVYIDMQHLGFRPNVSTFASVIGVSSTLAGLETGQQMQCQLMKSEFFKDIKMGSALIDMYSKCGRIEDARRVFDHMPRKNVFTWTSMIDGYGKNGNPNEALQLFHRMQECSIEPNYVTFLGILSACGHAGMVTKGREIFDWMERDYSLKPRMEHYACMVAMLGRAGSVNEAWKFVMEMPEKPNSDVWVALLSSCNLHDNVEMARIAANELFKFNAKDRPGAYVALSNTYAAVGKWDGVNDLRETMKLRGILKDTGCSWIGTESG